MKQQVEGKFSLLAKSTIVGVVLLVLALIPNLLRADRILIDDFEVGIKEGTTTPYVLSLTTTKTTDPAGHGCCVTLPPSLIEVLLIEGDLVLREVNGGNAIPWLDFDAMVLDSNRDFVSESRATVAGFSNILTVLSGNITQDGITGSFTIGADGGLPSAEPIIFEFAIPTVNYEFFISQYSYLGLQATTGLGIDITTAPEDIEAPNELHLILRDDLKAPAADWWLVTLSGGVIKSFDLETLTFQPGLRPTYQGPTIDIPEPVKFSDFPELPPQGEDITVFFGIDTNQNGLLDEDLLTGVGYTFYFL
ncbi:MAG: hypothetical protein DHS20C12_09540 [Pseudohongiella sp.]|nr:MAG: hypothetical protein DHS20C12_09540 [Pseudohongiella sp.]